MSEIVMLDRPGAEAKGWVFSGPGESGVWYASRRAGGGLVSASAESMDSLLREILGSEHEWSKRPPVWHPAYEVRS
jgi:hypothetical protein